MSEAANHYEKLGAFYLGRETRGDGLLLYDSKDLVTHGVVVGMTGSGKTGLSVCLLEEALIDGIPVIAVDPKGDLGNLLLTFPELKAADFAPWVDPQAARREGLTPEAFAAREAERWRQGLAAWHQDGGRIRRLREAAEGAIYTPGSSAGLPVSLLRSFEAPSAETSADEELLRERVQAAVGGLLGLVGVAADPLQSREHVLLSMIFAEAWRRGHGLTLAELIPRIQKPPFDRVGLFDTETYYPATDRMRLAMLLNGLAASPGFSAWLEGPPLDIARLLRAADGRPRLAIFSIAHLGDAERMFFMSTLLDRVVEWMRRQGGTSSLRAILYIDEVFGFLPPVANPPSKPPLLTLLKQGRASGLGVLLATQNPKDLDYKALSNAGTWFTGRLQTDRDQERVLDALEGSAAGSGRAFDRSAAAARLAALGKRVFLLHNVHEDRPVEFETRWALSYLRGPLQRGEIQRLMEPARREPDAPAAAPVERAPSAAAGRPVFPPGVEEYFLPVRSPAPAGAGLVYRPGLLGSVRTHYEDARRQIDAIEELHRISELANDRIADLDWGDAATTALTADDLETSPVEGPAEFEAAPAAALKAASYTKWRQGLARWVYAERPLELFRSPGLGLLSRPGESEPEFRGRLEHAAHEERDRRTEALRQKYAPRIARLEERIRARAGGLAREQEQAKQQKMSATISVGATLVGALFGRKLASSTNVRSAGAAMRSMSRNAKEAEDVRRAEENLQAVQQELKQLEQEFLDDQAAIASGAAVRTEALEREAVRARKTNIDVRFCGFVWLPCWTLPDGRRERAWAG